MKTNYVSNDGTVIKNVIKHGKISNKPLDGSIVHLHIENVQVIPPDSIDISKLHSEILIEKPDVVFTVDETSSEIDRQIERAIKWMGENEKASVRIILPSLLLKSDEINVGNTPQIRFDIFLAKHEAFKPMWEWTPQEKYERAAKYKELAVKLVHDNRIKDAFYKFSKAVKIIITIEPIDNLELEEALTNDINSLRISIYNNMAMCQLKFNNYDHVISLCTKVLMRDKNNVKALYRRGCAFGGIKNVEKALIDFQTIVHIQPTNAAALEKLKIYAELWTEANKRSDEVVRKMFKI